MVFSAGSAFTGNAKSSMVSKVPFSSFSSRPLSKALAMTRREVLVKNPLQICCHLRSSIFGPERLRSYDFDWNLSFLWGRLEELEPMLPRGAQLQPTLQSLLLSSTSKWKRPLWARGCVQGNDEEEEDWRLHFSLEGLQELPAVVELETYYDDCTFAIILNYAHFLGQPL